MNESPEAGRTALAEALHRAADGVAPPAMPGDLWTRGRRERRRRTVRRVGAVVAAVVAAALGLPALGVVAPPVIGPAATKVSGYPMRINHQWVVRDLPARPGPLAALVEVSESDGAAGVWRAVSPSGHQWRLPSKAVTGGYPALSADGRYLAFMEPDGLHFRIRDLVRGDSTLFGGVSDGASGPGVSRDTRGLLFSGQLPAFFSPDGQQLAFSSVRLETFGAPAAPSLVAVLDRRSGRVRDVPLPGDRSLMIGWSGPDSVWVFSGAGPSSQSDLNPQTVPRLTLTDLGLEGRVRSTRTISPKGGLDPGWLSQWTGPVSPDGTALALFGGTTDAAVYRQGPGLIRFSDEGQVSACPAVWVGDRVAFPTIVPTTGSSTPIATNLLTRLQQRPDGVAEWDTHRLAVISSRLRPTCVIWAADALAAGPTGWHPFGTSSARWTWYAPELTLTALLAALGAAVLVIRRRTRRRRIS